MASSNVVVVGFRRLFSLVEKFRSIINTSIKYGEKRIVNGSINVLIFVTNNFLYT